MVDEGKDDANVKDAKARRLRRKEILLSRFPKRRKSSLSDSTTPLADITNTNFTSQNTQSSTNRNHKPIPPFRLIRDNQKPSSSDITSARPFSSFNPNPSVSNISALYKHGTQTSLPQLHSPVPNTKNASRGNPFYRPKHPFPINSPNYHRTNSTLQQRPFSMDSPSILRSHDLMSKSQPKTTTPNFTQPTSSNFQIRNPRKASTSHMTGINLLNRFEMIDTNITSSSTAAENVDINDESDGSANSEDFEAYNAVHQSESESSDEDDLTGSQFRDSAQYHTQGSFLHSLNLDKTEGSQIDYFLAHS